MHMISHTERCILHMLMQWTVDALIFVLPLYLLTYLTQQIRKRRLLNVVYYDSSLLGAFVRATSVSPTNLEFASSKFQTEFGIFDWSAKICFQRVSQTNAARFEAMKSCWPSGDRLSIGTVWHSRSQSDVRRSSWIVIFWIFVSKSHVTSKMRQSGRRCWFVMIWQGIIDRIGE